jgi:hypothetical protein
MLSWRHACRRVHPLWAIQAILNEALGELSPTFAKLYARPAVDPAQADALLAVAAGLLSAPNASASGIIVWTVRRPRRRTPWLYRLLRLVRRPLASSVDSR